MCTKVASRCSRKNPNNLQYVWRHNINDMRFIKAIYSIFYIFLNTLVGYILLTELCTFTNRDSKTSKSLTLHVRTIDLLFSNFNALLQLRAKIFLSLSLFFVGHKACVNTQRNNNIIKTAHISHLNFVLFNQNLIICTLPKKDPLFLFAYKEA